MTLTAEPGALWADDRFDRRGAALETRRSWASVQPFERRRTTLNSDPSRLATAWRTVGTRYALGTAALEALLAGAVSYVCAATAMSLTAATLVAAAFSVMFVLLVALCGGYRSDVLGDGPAEFQSVIRAVGLLALVPVALSFALGLAIPRGAVLVGVPTLAVAAGLTRYLRRRRLHAARQQGIGVRQTVVIGDRHSVKRVVDDLGAAPHHGYRVDSVCLPSLEGAESISGVPVVGAVADVVQVVADRAAEVVIVTGSCLSGDGLRRLSWALGHVGAHMVVAPDLVEVTGPRLTVRPTAGLSLLEVEVDTPRRRLIAKAVLDVVLAVLVGILVLPVVLVAATAIRLTSAGPVFFRQTRIGVDGRPFTIWKLRTMYVDAAARRAALDVQNQGAGVLFKMHADPRVTGVGRVLRRFSLDELPQLWNVIRGDMSLVGPRPPLASEVEAYEDRVHRRLHVKPGLTGLWQVSGRSDLDWDEAVRLDLRYVDNWSVAMDLMILWKTGRAVLFGAGAY